MSEAPRRVVGRYAIYGEIASGGMATVHFGRLLGPAGFARTVAVKRLHEQYARDPEFVSMFLDEARLAARIRHPNVVDVLDVVVTKAASDARSRTTAGELFLVMEYVHGESLSGLMKILKKNRQKVPPRILAAVVVGALQGLHAAHEAKDEHGAPLGIVHRDVSPHNIIVGADGIPRVLDFGVAKAAGRLQSTQSGQLKGKIAYMAPEQIAGRADRRTDVWSMGVVLWEGLVGERLFDGDNEAVIIDQVRNKTIEPPSFVDIEAPKAFDAVISKALARDPSKRYASAREMAKAVEGCVGVASAAELSEWTESVAAERLDARARNIADVESSSAFPALDADAAQELLGTGRPSPPPPPVAVPSPRKPIDVAHAPTIVDRTPSRPSFTPPTAPSNVSQRVVVVHKDVSEPKRQSGSVLFTAFVLLLVGGIVTVFWLMANSMRSIWFTRDFPWNEVQQILSPAPSGSTSASGSAGKK